MHHLLKLYLPIYLLAYLLIAFVIPTVKTYKKTGINPITFGKSDNTHDYIGLVMKLLIACLFTSVFIFSISNNLYLFLVPIYYLSHQPLTWIAIVLINLALIWIGISQFQISTSWRIGIDEKNKTKLITTGQFSIS